MTKRIGVKTPQNLAIQKGLPKKKVSRATSLRNRRENASNFGNPKRFAKEKSLASNV
jgi:hypothetical protein